MNTKFVSFAVVALLLFDHSPITAQPLMENLDRGLIAIHQPDGKVFVSWRLLATDSEEVAFNLYRTSEGGGLGRGGLGRGGRLRPSGPITAKLNDDPISGATWCLDDGADLSRETVYTVRTTLNGAEGVSSRGFTFHANAPSLPYLSIPLQTPEGSGPNDASVGDLDGDGDYEYVIKMEMRPRDNSQGGMTGETKLQAYKLDGTLLWTINLGKNIREGAHYTQFMVYDLDGDGKAEVACKTADGTTDGRGHVIGDANADHRNTNGHILSGPEYLTVFDGLTGGELATTDYIPPRHPTRLEPTPEELNAIWGDGRGNRSDRYLACVAYLDGARPSLVMCRGYYTRTVLAAWDWRDGRLTKRWVFDSDEAGPANRDNPYRGQGNHNLSVADVDGDGRDEIVYGACVIDDDGTGLYSTRWGHGDAMHVSDLVPENPGLEVFNIQERFAGEGMNMRDARTGKPIFLVPSVAAATSGGDQGEGPGRGNSFNIDPRHPGAESWAAGAGMTGLFNTKGERISESKPRSCNFAVWWDGDLLREILDQNRISKWNWTTETLEPLLVAHASTSNNGTKATPALSADILGDWREEVIWATRDGNELRIYTTTMPTPHRMVTLMHDRQYRLAIAWQNVAYNQPPHPSFYLDESAPLPPRPQITVVNR
ncbi:MAG: rhamnogalacturonan lyase [Verrucomicrobia bacterium]|nr:rhamnogalacturonan lyase [Verrucomicrobiota bacterium]